MSKRKFSLLRRREEYHTRGVALGVGHRAPGGRGTV
jgi:hypothetical protein